MKIPKADKAVIAKGKLCDYLLNPVLFRSIWQIDIDVPVSPDAVSTAEDHRATERRRDLEHMQGDSLAIVVNRRRDDVLASLARLVKVDANFSRAQSENCVPCVSRQSRPDFDQPRELRVGIVAK